MEQGAAVPQRASTDLPAARPGQDGSLGISDDREMTDEQKAEYEKSIKLDAFGQSLAKTRSAAIGYRQQSGIEEIWQEDQDFYEGVDDLNRGDEHSIRTDKPPVAGTSRGTKTKGARGQSRVFPNISAPFCEAAAAHISDILLPTEDRPWSFDPTPVPEVIEQAEAFAKENPDAAKESEKVGFLQRASDFVKAQSNEVVARNDAQEDQSEGMSKEDAFELSEMAKAIAEATEIRVWDWHVECQFNAQVRLALEDASKTGTGVIKGPVPKNQMNIGWKAPETTKDELGNAVESEGKIVITMDTTPITKRIDYENLFPAPGCGDNVQNGDYVWERDFITIRQLRKLKKDPSYMTNQIDMILLEGPTRAIAMLPETQSLTTSSEMKDKFEVWYGYCMAEREDLEAAGCECGDIKDAHLDTFVTLVNNRVIKASLPTTDYTGFPYDVFCWRKRKNFWAGIGVARQVRTAQKIVVGATRSMMNNAGLAGGPMLVFKQGVVRPADGVAGLAPRKIFYIAKDDQTIQDATKAIGQIKVDIMVNEMMAIINYGLQIAENNSGFPMLMQGQMGNAPELVGVVNVLDKNTNAIKRRLGRNFSDDVMVPHLRRYYVYHLMYGPDNEKGDLQVNVKGYASLVERDIQNQELGQMYTIVLDPRFGLDPKKWAEEFLKSKHLPAADLQVDDEKWGEMLEKFEEFQQWQSGGTDAMQVAQVRADGQLAVENLKGQFSGALKLSDQQYDAMKSEMDRNLQLLLKSADAELGMMREAGATEASLRQSKTVLAKTVLDIQATWKLAMSNARAKDLPPPPLEPPGRAPVGESFTQ